MRSLSLLAALLLLPALASAQTGPEPADTSDAPSCHCMQGMAGMAAEGADDVHAAHGAATASEEVEDSTAAPAEPGTAAGSAHACPCRDRMGAMRGHGGMGHGTMMKGKDAPSGEAAGMKGGRCHRGGPATPEAPAPEGPGR